MKVPKQCIKSCDEAEYLEKEDLTLLIIGSGLLGKIGKSKPEKHSARTQGSQYLQSFRHSAKYLLSVQNF